MSIRLRKLATGLVFGALITSAVTLFVGFFTSVYGDPLSMAMLFLLFFPICLLSLAWGGFFKD